MLDRPNDISGVASTLGRICQACRWTPCTASTLMVRRSLSYLGSRSTTTPQSASHARNYLFLSISPSLQTTIVAVDSDRHQASDQETANEMHRHGQCSQWVEWSGVEWSETSLQGVVAKGVPRWCQFWRCTNRKKTCNPVNMNSLLVVYASVPCSCKNLR
jgi:hypothetical protein